jgi:hypothetical protein
LRRRCGTVPGLASIKLSRVHDVGDMERPFPSDDLAIRVLLAFAHVPLDHVNSFDNDPLFLGGDGDDPSAFAFVGSGNDHHLVVLLNVKALHIFFFQVRITANYGGLARTRAWVK